MPPQHAGAQAAGGCGRAGVLKAPSLVQPQLATLALRGWLSRGMAALRTRDEPLPCLESEWEVAVWVLP